MPKKVIKLSVQDFTFAVAAVFLVGAIIGIALLPKAGPGRAALISESSVEMGIPAVDAQGNGVLGTLYTTVRPGTGKILVNVDNILSQIDTQFSSRTAVKAAAVYMNMDPESVDVIFTLKVNATMVEGPSAGSAMAASVVLALGGAPAGRRIMMTGTIEEDGSVGNVGSIAEKAAAAKGGGAEIFIVPAGQSTDTMSRKERACESFDSVTICRINYVREKVSISSPLNMTIVEAGTLAEIMDIYRNLK
ncbi:MAG: hypothetical protein HYW27_00435 [Candidatus Aenigmarchaeota archaeon]|nr:hypothetical protein [Candidatus Aenigmarchaeota archaeon]